MKRSIASLFLFLLSISLFATNAKDFEFLVDNLPKLHKNFFNSNTEDDFYTFSNNIPKTEEMSYMEFYYLLMQSAAYANDSHTTIGMATIPEELMLLPIRFISFPDGVYIFATNKDNGDLAGTRLTGINGYSLNEIYKKAQNVIPHDNDVFEKENTISNLIFMDFLSYIGIAKNTKDSILITIEDEGISKGKIIVPVSNDVENGSDYNTVFQSIPLTYTNNSFYRTLVLDNDTYFIQYNTCKDHPNMSVSDFTDSVIEDLKNNTYKKVIVDFRYNGGGNSSLFEPMMDYLKDSGYKLYGLIGSRTFSSGVMNALYFKKCGATLVGTPTGGNVNGYGEINLEMLPSGKYYLQYSTEYFYLDDNYESILTPDIYISTSFHDFLNGEDKEVEYCLTH